MLTRLTYPYLRNIIFRVCQLQIASIHTRERCRVKKNDMILFGVLLGLGLLLILILNIMKYEGSKVLITIDGKEYKTMTLEENATLTIELENGGWNIFQIKDGYVDMLDASCPDKLCVKHRDIHYNNETIVCLPNKVVLQVIDGEESELDAVAD